MAETNPARAHVIAGGFPPGSLAGHDQDYARLRLLFLLAEQQVPASVANDFADIEKWLKTSRLPDGRTRVVAYSRDIGKGGIAYVALGHCHNPAIHAARPPNPADKSPPSFHGPWETAAFLTLLRNAIAWGVEA